MAQEQPRPIEVRAWAGLVTNASPHALDPGSAQEQENCRSLKAGTLEVRRGLKEITWDN